MPIHAAGFCDASALGLPGITCQYRKDFHKNMYKSSLSASLPSELCSAHCQAVLQALSSPPTPARASATSSELDFDASETEAYPAWKLSSHSVATTAESHGEPLIAQRTVLELPYPIIQRLIACAGAAGAAAAQTCTSLAKAWADALACPELFARFLLSKHGATTAMFYIYSEGAQRHLLKNASSTAEQDCVLDAVVGHLLQAGASIRPQVSRKSFSLFILEKFCQSLSRTRKHQS